MAIAGQPDLEDLFWQGVALPAHERANWLERTVPDPNLRQVVAGMLQADEDPDASVLSECVSSVFGNAAPIAETGTRLGPYRIVRELGQGGAGVVYLAERADDQFELNVAIKIIRSATSEDGARQLRRERQLLASLSHPNIARLIDGGETAGGHPYLVMEYVVGEPITAACDRSEAPVADRVRLLIEASKAVHYAHQRLVVHRDIKPGNILVREDGRPVLLDFGIASLLDAEPAIEQASREWFTPGYASPEQRRGERVGTSADIYSLGVILFELLTGTIPDPALDVMPKPSASIDPAYRRMISGDLDAIVARACACDPALRYASALDLADDLERWLRVLPVRARAPTPRYLLGKLLRRRPVEAAVFAVFVATLAATGFRLLEERNRATSYANDAEAVTEFLIDLFRESRSTLDRRTTPTASDLIDFGSERLARRYDLPDHLRARIAGTLGDIYRSLGEPTKATEVLETAVELSARSLDRYQHAEHLRLLARTLDHRGRYADAEQRFRQVFALLQPYDDDGQRAVDLSNIGHMLSRQRKFAQAEQLITDALQLAVAAFGREDPRTAEIEIYHAEMLSLSERNAEVPDLLHAIGVIRAAYPADHPSLLSARVLHANVLRENARPQLAEQILRDVLRTLDALPYQHIWLTSSAHNLLGQVHYDEGRTADAARHFDAALALARRALSDQDPILAVNMNNLGSVYEELGDFERAEVLLRQALAIVQGNPRGQELQLARFRQNLGRTLMLAGKASEARQHLEHPIADVDDVRFVLQRARQAAHLAEWHRRFGSAAEAHRWLDRVEAEPQSIGGAQHPRYAFTLRTRARLLVRNGEHDAARTLLEQALSIMVSARSERYVGAGLVHLELAELELDRGNRSEARAASQAAADVLDSSLAPDALDRQRLDRLRRSLANAP